jgi:tripartite-type tricarboxylate transporter receptor subunit TctC
MKLHARTACAIGLLLALAAFAVPAAAQDYPARSIRLIIPFAPGGSNDVVGRIIANQLGRKLGKQVLSTTAAAPAAWSAPTSPPRRRRTATRC